MTVTTAATPGSGVSPRPPLFPHQETALRFLRERRRAALFLDMGAG